MPNLKNQTPFDIGKKIEFKQIKSLLHPDIQAMGVRMCEIGLKTNEWV